ncbi:MAG: GDP-mannose 4,6-dehydratase [candidate division WOR-3 bacterium]|nr:GDP-mannose 4,6-dehydratase [candidate division WOR-3 bacterium]
MKRILITGAEGFVAGYLADALKRDSNELFGTHFVDNKNDIESSFLDITDSGKVYDMLEQIQPDIICHLAAQSSGGLSYKKPVLTYKTNVMGTLNILESVRRINPDILVFIPSSADVIGIPEYLPVDEEHPRNPLNPYSSSKSIIEDAARQYELHYNLRILITHSFNHTGVGQDSKFFMPSMLEQVRKAPKNGRIMTGDLTIQRDFMDVRDVADAYKSLIDVNLTGIYNVASGKPVELGTMLEYLIDLSGKNLQIVRDSSRIRSGETKTIYGTYDKLNCSTGWRPQRDIFRTIEWMYKEQ